MPLVRHEYTPVTMWTMQCISPDFNTALLGTGAQTFDTTDPEHGRIEFSFVGGNYIVSFVVADYDLSDVTLEQINSMEDFAYAYLTFDSDVLGIGAPTSGTVEFGYENDSWQVPTWRDPPAGTQVHGSQRFPNHFTPIVPSVEYEAKAGVPSLAEYFNIDNLIQVTYFNSLHWTAADTGVETPPTIEDLHIIETSAPNLPRLALDILEVDEEGWGIVT